MSSARKMLTIQGTRQSHLQRGSERDNECDLDRARRRDIHGGAIGAASFLTSTNSRAAEVARRKAIE